MARRRPHRHCRECQKPREEVGRLSAIGLCATCGPARMIDNVEGLRAHSGPAFRRWREGVAASVGAIIPDASTASETTERA